MPYDLPPTATGAIAAPKAKFDVEKDFGAVPDDFYQDGVSIYPTTPFTFSSATANFTPADVGKEIWIQKGYTFDLPLVTTIATYISPSAVTLTATLHRPQVNMRFMISRNGSQSSKIQNAAWACAAAGGGTVTLSGVGYLADATFVLPNRVILEGRNEGMWATCLHVASTWEGGPIVRNDYTTDNSAENCGVRNLMLTGAADYVSNTFTGTLGAAYTAGQGFMTVGVGQGASMLPAGTLNIGGFRYLYSGIIGDVLQNVEGGVEDTVDTNQSNGASFYAPQNHGIYLVCQPINTTPLYADSYDPHYIIENVLVHYCRGYGVYVHGQSEARLNNVYAAYCEEVGIRPSWDTWLSNCTSTQSGRMGYYVRGSSGQGSNLKSFGNGNVDPTKGHGFLFEGPAQIEEGCKVWTGINAQDNFGHGIYLRQAQRIIVMGSSSSNCLSSSSSFAAVAVDGCSNGVVIVVATDRVATPTQINGLRFVETLLPNSGMQVILSHGATSGSSTSDALQPGYVLTDPTNSIIINGVQVWGGHTPTLFVETANRTIYANNQQVVFDYHELASGAVLELASGGRLMIEV